MEWTNGILQEQGPWESGKRNGLFRFYDQWGQLEDVVKYFEGEVVLDAVETQELIFERPPMPTNHCDALDLRERGAGRSVHRVR